MNKSKGVVAIERWESSTFNFPLKKNCVFFFFKGAHGLGFGLGALLLIDVSCTCFFFFFTQWWRAGIHFRPKFIIYTNIDTNKRTETYAYIYIYLWRREGAVMRKLKTMTSHRGWYEQSIWAVLAHCKKLIFLFYRSNIGGAQTSWFPCGQGSVQQLQAGLMLGPGLGF